MKKILISLAFCFSFALPAQAGTLHTMMRETDGVAISQSTTSVRSAVDAIQRSTPTITAGTGIHVSGNAVISNTITDYSQLTGIGNQTPIELEQRIGALENNQSGYPQSIYSVNFSTGDSFVNVDTTTYPSKISLSEVNNSLANSGGAGGGNPILPTYTGAAKLRQMIIPNISTRMVSLKLLMFRATDYAQGDISVGISDINMNILISSTIAVNSLPYHPYGNFTQNDLSINQSTPTTIPLAINLVAETSYYIVISSETYAWSSINNSSFLTRAQSYSRHPSGSDVYSNIGAGYTWFNNDNYNFIFQINVSSPLISAGSFQTTLSSSATSNFNFWGQLNVPTTEPDGSSVTLKIQPRASYSDNSQAWQTITNKTLIPYTSAYLGIEIDFTRTVSTATPIVDPAYFKINYAPALLSVGTTNHWTGTNTFTQINVSSITASGEITTGYGFFHDRGDVASLDYNLSALYPTGNNTDWHNLDLSSKIPVGTKAVLLDISIAANATDGVYLKKGGNVNDFNRSDILCAINGQEQREQRIVPCDSNRVIQYKTPYTTVSVLNINISGWWK